MNRFLALLLVLCGAARVAAAAAPVQGFPLITVYPSEVHKAGPQNFEIAQDARGVLYIGNLAGLLTWDGAWWRLLTLPDEQAPLAVASDAKGTVMIGMVDDLGTVAADVTGAAQFRSLVPFIPREARAFGEVTAICVAGDAFLFVAEKHLFVWDGTAMRVVPSPASTPRGCYADDGGLWVYGRSGLQQFDLRTMRAEAPLFAGKRIDLVLRAADGKLVAAVRDDAVYSIDGAAISPYAPSVAQLKGTIVNSGTRLRDGRLVIGTRQRGVGIFDRAGNLEEWINDESGLPDAVLGAAFTDREGALWLAMEGPIVRIDVATPVSLFDSRRGLKGSLSDVVQHGGRIWATTSHGLFVFDAQGVARPVEGIEGSAWNLLPFDDQLLVATSKGLYRLHGDSAAEQILITDFEVYDMSRSRTDPARVWLGIRTGAQSVRWDGAKWMVERRVSPSPEYITTILEENGVLFCGTVFNGVVRIDDPFGKPRTTQYGTGEMNVFAGAGRVLFVSAAGRIVAPAAGGKLVPDPQLGHVAAPRGFFVVAEDREGNIWLNSTPPRVVRKLSDGRYAPEGEPLVAVTAADIQAVRAWPSGVVWFGADKGLFLYEPSSATPTMAQPAPLIRRVVAGEDRVLYGGEGVATADLVLRHAHGRIRIEFAPASYRPGVMYQYRLDPTDAGWSAWTDQPFIDYTNLDAADYVFRLRSRGPAAAPSREAVWAFSVPPPWYRTAWAYVLWGIAAAVLIAAIIALRTRALRRQAEQLRTQVAEQTEELRHKNELLERLSLVDELTGIANRRFFEKALADEWNRAVRREEPLSLILLDLDRFKELNDLRGHRAGDECLRTIGRYLGETVRRSGEVVARYGGEEFAVLLPGTDTLDATRAAERLRAGIERLELWQVTTSCGVATMLPRLGESMEQLVDRADRALYAAKHAGRNAVRVANRDDNEDVKRWMI